MNRASLFLLLSLVTLLTACSPIARPEQLGTDQKILLVARKSVGQTFVAEYEGLMGVEITIRAQAPSVVRYHLQAEPDRADDLVEGEITLQQGDVPIFVQFPFAPQTNSNQTSYYFSVETDSVDPLVVRAAPGTTYLNGAAYAGEEPLDDAQLAFRLVYHPGWLVWGLIKQGLSWLGMLGVFGGAYILPGWVMLKLLWPGWEQREGVEKLILAAGAGLVVYPLFVEWTDVVGLHLGAWNAWFPSVLAGGYLVWGSWGRIVNRKWRIVNYELRITNYESFTFWVVVGLVFATRFWAMRSLDAPMWGDAFQHTMMAQLLVDQGGLFDAWRPYAEISTFTYHFGFHVHAAVLHWLTGMSVAQAVLWAGQILNGLAVLGLYPLAKKVGGSGWAGIGAVLVAGFLTSMPMFYINWGRYTQLTGQVLLVVLLLAVWEILDDGQDSWRSQVLVGVLMAGLALTHYRVIVFGVLFLPVAWMVWVRCENFWASFKFTFWVGVVGGGLFLPQFIHVFGGKILEIFARQMSTPPSALSEAGLRYNAIGELSAFLPGWVWALALICLGWGLWRRNRGVLALGLWFALIVVAANPAWVGLPGSGSLSNFAVFISAYIPAGVLLGSGLGWAGEKFQDLRGAKWALLVGYMGLVVGLAVWGVQMRIAEVAPAQFGLVTRPDVQAAAWVEKNLPEDAHFLVNGFLTDGDISVVGADAGWWLPLLAHRSVTIPPLTYMTEQNFEADFRAELKQLMVEMRSKGVMHPDVLALLAAQGVTHVYIGQLQGRVNAPGPALNPLELQRNEHFRVVYHEDRVWIFEVVP